MSLILLMHNHQIYVTPKDKLNLCTLDRAVLNASHSRLNE